MYSKGLRLRTLLLLSIYPYPNNMPALQVKDVALNRRLIVDA
jgi:hypothetical protein